VLVIDLPNLGLNGLIVSTGMSCQEYALHESTLKYFIITSIPHEPYIVPRKCPPQQARIGPYAGSPCTGMLRQS
jgi:hypothetical protein